MDYDSMPSVNWDTGGFAASILNDGKWGKFLRDINAYYRRNGLDTGDWKKRHHDKSNRHRGRASEPAEVAGQD